MELDWAMAHMETSKTEGKKKNSESFLDLDVKVTKEDVGILCYSRDFTDSLQGDLRGLGSLLFDDINGKFSYVLWVLLSLDASK